MPAPMLRYTWLAVVVAVLACFALVACEEEAVVNPSAPPQVAVKELAELKAPTSAPALAPVPARVPEVKGKKAISMEDFMADYIEVEMKKAYKSKARNETLEAYLRLLPPLFPDDEKFKSSYPAKSWQSIVDAALQEPKSEKMWPAKYGQSCKQCHATWKKPYRKAYRGRMLEIDTLNRSASMRRP